MNLEGVNVFCGVCSAEWRNHQEGKDHDFEPGRVEYVTDDRDDDDRRGRMKLVISFGGNGDLYVATCREGEKGIYGVRLSTSGGASSDVPGLCPSVAEAFRSIAAAHTGKSYAGREW